MGKQYSWLLILNLEDTGSFCEATDTPIPYIGLLLSCMQWIPQNHLWCNTCSPIDQHIPSLMCFSCLHAIDCSVTPLVQYLLLSYWPVWQSISCINILSNKHWCGWSPESNMLLPYSKGQGRRSTDLSMIKLLVTTRYYYIQLHL